MRKVRLRIRGMNCLSCETLIENQLKKVAGLKSCRVSHKTGEAEVVCASSVSDRRLHRAIEDSGYKVYLGSGQDGEPVAKPDYGQIFWIFVAVSLAAWLLGRLDLVRFLPDVGGQVTVWLALLMGLAASLSTCLALTGGLVMSFGAKVRAGGAQAGLWDRSRPHLLFHLGRFGGFMVLGGLLGLLGDQLNLSLTATGWLTVVVALIMFYVGLSVLGVVPNVTALGLHLPKSWGSRIESLKEKDSLLMPLGLGVLTFFLPCGFTQSMQVAAAASQSFLSGALTMGMFALGTAPVLLSIGIGSTYAHARSGSRWLYRTIGMVVVFFAVYSFNSGLVLAGSSWTVDFWKRAEPMPVSTPVQPAAVQVVEMTVDWSYQPNRFTIQKGVPVRWEIYGKNVNGCSNEIVIPSMGLRWPLRQGMNVLEFTPTKTGRLPFSCWMGMLRGEFNVIE